MALIDRVLAASTAVLLGAGALLLAACQSAPPPAPPPAPAVNEEALAEQARRTACEGELAEAREALAACETAVRAAEEQAVELKVRLLEKSAEARELADRQAAQQRQLDEAIQEVVRAKAKLRSLESRADAASAMAEAEITLKALAGQKSGAGREELAKAGELLRMSGQEFEKENYGGALFLATQAKSHLREAEARPAPRGAPLPDEVAFAAPLRMVVVTGANLREGPGMEFRVIATVARGSVVTATSRKSGWVRVSDERGTAGWIFHSLLGER